MSQAHSYLAKWEVPSPTLAVPQPWQYILYLQSEQTTCGLYCLRVIIQYICLFPSTNCTPPSNITRPGFLYVSQRTLNMEIANTSLSIKTLRTIVQVKEASACQEPSIRPQDQRDTPCWHLHNLVQHQYFHNWEPPSPIMHVSKLPPLLIAEVLESLLHLAKNFPFLSQLKKINDFFLKLHHGFSKNHADHFIALALLVSHGKHLGK